MLPPLLFDEVLLYSRALSRSEITKEPYRMFENTFKNIDDILH